MNGNYKYERSYGAMLVTLSYLPQIEVTTRFQQLSKWWYEIGAGRIQTKFCLYGLEAVYFLNTTSDHLISIQAFKLPGYERSNIQII